MVSLNFAQTLVKSGGWRLEFHVLLAKSEIILKDGRILLKLNGFMCLLGPLGPLAVALKH